MEFIDKIIQKWHYKKRSMLPDFETKFINQSGILLYVIKIDW